jgi:hypothetical protein
MGTSPSFRSDLKAYCRLLIYGFNVPAIHVSRQISCSDTVERFQYHQGLVFFFGQDAVFNPCPALSLHSDGLRTVEDEHICESTV